jgi:hypothetical protein
MRISDEGSVVLFTPDNTQEKQWLDENTTYEPYQWLGPSLVVEHRFAVDIVEGVKEAGFKFEVTQHEWSTP